MDIAKEWKRSRLSKLTVTLVAGSGLSWLFMLITGAMTDELRGYIAFGTIVACVIMWIASALSSKALPSTFSLVRAGWLGWALVALMLGLALGQHGDGAAAMSYAMNALAFPSGLIALPLGGPLAAHLPWGAAVTFLWALLAAVGYLQWFVIVARVIGRRVSSSNDSH